MPDQTRNRPHLHLEGNGKSRDFTSPKQPRPGLPPPRVRAEHARNLLIALGAAITNARAQFDERPAADFEGERGFYLQFDIPIGHRKALDGLAQPSKGIEIVAVQPVEGGDEVVRSTVFVPEQAADHFIRKVELYRDEESRKGQPKNQKLVASITDARLGDVRAIFTDEMALFPALG
ncbi:hypothetical protein ACQVP2_31840 [Methylobacterium aquaticum]|uniref:hypothetical protein n=1 Tax=Methylobacterium aquaticum TaxID=270351 RepID=UPI003D16A042